MKMHLIFFPGAFGADPSGQSVTPGTGLKKRPGWGRAPPGWAEALEVIVAPLWFMVSLFVLQINTIEA